MKKVISLILAIAMLFAIVVQAGGAPAQRMQVKIIADKTEVQAGDTVSFTVVLGPVTNVGSIQISMDIPAGLTYVQGSGSIADGARAAMGFDMLAWTDDIQMINGSASAGNYQSSSDTTLATFACTVDDGASGTMSLGVKDLEIGDCKKFEIFSELFDIVTADVTVVGSTPVAEPTTAPVTQPVYDPTTKPLPTERMQVKVVADKAEAQAGDTVNFAVVLGPVTDVGSIQIFVDIPDGLTYVDGSGSIADGVINAMGFDMLYWTDKTLMINGSASGDDYESSGDTTIATFACTVDDDASGTLSVGLYDVEMGTCVTFNILTDLFDIVPASVTITSRPTVPPTESATETPVTHRHRLTRVREVPATEESEGVKAHYVCSGENGCGKIFQDYFGTVELTEEDLIIPRLTPATNAPATEPVVEPTMATESATEPVVPTTIPEPESPTEAEPIIGPTMPPTEPVAPTAAPVTEPESVKRMQIRVDADKSAAAPGDTINFAVVLGPVTDVGSIQMFVDIPDGLTYVDGSGSIADGVINAMGFDMLYWTEKTLMINGSASGGDYESSGDTTIATFACTVDDDASGTLSVGLYDVEMGTCVTFNILTDLFDIVPASVTITSRPTVPPTENATEKPATHRHRLTRVREVPATEESEGVKAHYVCSGENGCGKIFQDYFGTVELTEEDLIIPRLTPATNAPATEPVVIPTTATEPATEPVVPTTIPEPESPTEAEPIIGPTMPPTEPVVPTAAPVTEPVVPTIATESATEPVVPTENPTEEPVTHVHSLTYVEEIPATEESEGVKAHYICGGEDGCSRIFEDAFATIELTKADLVIPRLVPSTEPVIEPTASTEPVVEPTTATEPVIEPTTSTEPVVESTTSTEPVVEPTTATEPVTHVHSLTYVEEIPATEESEGVKAHYICGGEDGCGRIFEDAFATIELTKADLVIPRLVPSTEPVVEPTMATESVVEPTTATEPVVEPTTATEPVVEPTTANEPVVEPTTATEPVTHVHSLTYVEEIPATEESEGVKAHYICGGEDGCGKIFEDALGTVELTEADLIIPMIVPVTEAPTVAPTQCPTCVRPPYCRPTTAPTEASTQTPTNDNGWNCPHSNPNNFWMHWYRNFLLYFGRPWYPIAAPGSCSPGNPQVHFTFYDFTNPFCWIFRTFYV